MKLELDLTRKHTFKDGIYDFMDGRTSIQVGESEIPIEVDYAWDYESDPVITPTIIHEWKYLDQLLAKYVINNAKSVLSIGGGGSSMTHQYLSPAAREFAILNTGKWDLENAQIPAVDIVTYLICAHGEDIPILNNQINAIEIPSTLDHVIDAKKVIEESYRVLRDGGKIGITLGNSESWYRKLVAFSRVRLVDNHEHHHNFHFTSATVEGLLATAGFIEIRTLGTAYLKLPKTIERRLTSPLLLSVHRFISNKILRVALGNSRGGMLLIYGVKPQKTLPADSEATR